MPVNYDKLWKILEERKMMKTELVRAAKISTNAMAKLGKNEDVRFEILVKICHKIILGFLDEEAYKGPFSQKTYLANSKRPIVK